MENSYLPKTPSSSSGNSSSESCIFELTRLNSTASSLFVENSKDALLRSANASTDKCTGWTNEKHNAFLDSLEASFVKQLHKSFVLHAEFVELNTACRNMPEKRSSSRGVKTGSHFLSKPEELHRFTEGSGENFVAEEKPSCKKMKTTLVDTAVKEQIVPAWNFGSPGVDSMFQRIHQVNLRSSSGNRGRS